MRLAKPLGLGRGRNYTPINRCVAFSEGPCRGLDAHSGMASIPIQGALRSPCAGSASYPFADLRERRQTALRFISASASVVMTDWQSGRSIFFVGIERRSAHHAMSAL